MKSIKNFLLVLLIYFLLPFNILFAQKFQGDLSFYNSSSDPNIVITARIYTSSIPFDGLVQSGTQWAPLNRIDTLQNGTFTRQFLNNGLSPLFRT